MAKPLTKVQKYFIEGHIGQLAVQAIADEIGASLAQVRNYIEKVGKTEKPAVEPLEEKNEDGVRPKSDLAKRLIKKTEGGKQNVVFMDPGVSQYLDEIRPKSTPVNDKFKDRIFRREE